MTVKKNEILFKLKLSPDCDFDGLVRVERNPICSTLAEKRVIQAALKISKNIDFVYFRRFLKDDVRTSQAVAYIIDNKSRKLSEEALAKLHHTLWLNGTVPLLYINNENSVDIFSCATEAVSEKASKWNYRPINSILSNMHNIDDEIDRFSAIRLANGTFWEDERNKGYINVTKSAHYVLLEKIKKADREIDGKSNPIARRLLLLTMLIKYLEDRGVFKNEPNFFSKYVKNAKSFLDVLNNGTVTEILELLKKLENKFNGDIFIINKKISQTLIKNIANIVRADTDTDNQLYFWDIYNFEHIPVEVISHIYQYFTEEGQGAVFTPILLVNLMLDQIMPLEKLKKEAKIFDPTCGSGIFLVSAFRRLIYINQQKSKTSLSPIDLNELLKKTIFGIEKSEEAAYITSFNLALAVCDALQPDIIWRELKFGKLINRNIYIGDFGEKGKDLLKMNKLDDGFDIILGNPPFITQLTPAIEEDLINVNRTIPNKQLAYYILLSCIEKYLSKTGKIFMIQPSGFLYNERVSSMRCDLFKKITVDCIFDFISIRNFFYDADTKVIAIQAQKKKPLIDHKISHLTFRRTVSIKEKICFELDYYDYHQVLQKDAIDEKYTWKVNLLGGGRLLQLTKRLKEYVSIENYIKIMGWRAGVGFKGKQTKACNQTEKKKETNKRLINKPLLLPEALTSEGIDKYLLGTVSDYYIDRPREEEIYHPPLMIVEENDSLHSGLWDDGFLAYTSGFIGIKVQPNEKSKLEKFYLWFKKNTNILRSCLHLLGDATMTGRATAAKKSDIMNLPYSENNDFDLVTWEIEMLEDIRNYMAEYVRLGQDSELLKKEATDQDLFNYSKTFLRLMNKTYPKLKKGKELKGNGLRLISFSFSEDDNTLEFDESNWLESLSKLITKENEITLRTQRIIKIYTGNIFIIVKPNKLRYWIRSTAIRDVDDVIVNILRGGK